MRQFNLEEYVKNPTRPIVSRDGESARIICTDRNPDYPIVALVGEATRVNCYTNKGRYFGDGVISSKDLFFASEKKEGWVNISHYDGIGSSNASRRIYDTKEEALKYKNKGYVDTVKIEWEE